MMDGHNELFQRLQQRRKPKGQSGRVVPELTLLGVTSSAAEFISILKWPAAKMLYVGITLVIHWPVNISPIRWDFDVSADGWCVDPAADGTGFSLFFGCVRFSVIRFVYTCVYIL